MVHFPRRTGVHFAGKCSNIGARQHEHFMPPIAATGRDLRLDLFRGLALWLIFLDHIPSNIVNWITIRNYGFSDATQIFVFISGYTAAFVYGRAMRDRWLHRRGRAHPQAASGRSMSRTSSSSSSSSPRSPTSHAASTTRSIPKRWAPSTSCSSRRHHRRGAAAQVPAELHGRAAALHRAAAGAALRAAG